MLFNSYPFIFLFLPITFIGFFVIARSNYHLAALWLALVSLFFYGVWNPQFVLLLLLSVGFNYGMGYAIGHARSNAQAAKNSIRLLVTSVVCNLALLGYFKYANFFISTANQIVGEYWGLMDIVLPLGISFFTFTQIAFLVDVYRGIAREYNFIHYLLFVTYFPHLIAGPVLHHKQMMPQLGNQATYRLNTDNINTGIMIFTIGLFKKVVLADQFSLYANPVFSSLSNGRVPNFMEAWVAALAYTLQLYFDFSGYSDMAVGISRMFNVNLPINFDSPYKSKNIIEFWRRWHITLSTFLRDYLYIPFGGNRYGTTRRYVNLMATMLLGGLWHGANWTFVFWGGLHGIYLVINHGWHALHRRLNFPSVGGAGLLAGGVTFLAVVVAWVFFRASSLDAALCMLKGMIGLGGVEFGKMQFGLSFPYVNIVMSELSLPSKTAMTWILLGLAIVWLAPNSQRIVGMTTHSGDMLPPKALLAKPTALCAFLFGMLFFVSMLTIASGKVSEFLYFQF